MPWYTTADARRDAERQAAKQERAMRLESDVELLKRAASAAGMRYSANWDPLEDDGDALRLAAKLQISVMFQASGVEARAYRGQFHIAKVPVSYESGDVEAAARRAIVLAAKESLSA